MPEIKYLWQEPNRLAQLYVYTAQERSPDDLMGLSVTGMLGQTSGDPGHQAQLNKAGTQTLGDWLKSSGKTLGDNPWENGQTLLDFAKSQGLEAGGRQMYDTSGRPLTLGSTGTISYSGDPSKPETWNPKVTWTKNGLGNAKVQWDTTKGDWTVTGTQPGSDQMQTIALSSTANYKAPAGATPGATPKVPAQQSGAPTPGKYTSAPAPARADVVAQGMSSSIRPPTGRLNDARGMNTLNSSLAGQQGLEQGQNLADFMRSMQAAYQPTGNPNYQFTRNPRNATALMPWSGDLPAEQLPGPGQQTPGLRDLIAAKAAGQTGPGAVPIVNAQNPQFAQNVMAAGGIQNAGPQGGLQDVLTPPGAPSPLGQQAGGK